LPLTIRVFTDPPVSGASRGARRPCRSTLVENLGWRKHSSVSAKTRGFQRRQSLRLRTDLVRGFTATENGHTTDARRVQNEWNCCTRYGRKEGHWSERWLRRFTGVAGPRRVGVCPAVPNEIGWLVNRNAPMHVLIAGGGVAGLEALLALSALARGQVDVDLLAPTDEFVYRPLLVAEPFGTAEVLRLELAPIVREAGARHLKAALASVDPAAHTVTTDAGTELQYEALLVALGARPVEALPGALTFGDEDQRRELAGVLAALGRRGTKRIAFVVPRQATWSIAAYELSLLTASERDARRLSGVEITLITHEAAPLDLFGPAASQLVSARLEEAGISLRLSTIAERFDRPQLRLDGAESLETDAVVALPALRVAPIRGLPQREGGFVQTDVQMHVTGLEDVWAAGDATWFPIKQGGLAAQQSDVAARAIAARAGVHVPVEPFQPVLRGALITGEAPEFLRSPLDDRDSGVATVGHPLWWPPAKVAGRYLGPLLVRELGEEPSEELVDRGSPAEPAVDEAEHMDAVDLVLAAADADARIGDYEGALRWLSLVEQLNLVIPSDYVTRRYEWRLKLDPNAPPDAAAERIDPSFESADAAISDLQRRLGWLREIEARTEGEMRQHLSHLDRGLDQLAGLTRRTGVLKGGAMQESEDGER
jgi:sulfide:quinone oxidoreductase